jgi:hypothetical protein
MKAKTIALVRRAPLLPLAAFLLLAALSVLLIPANASAASAATVTSPFTFSFSSSGTLYEAGSMGQSSSPYFWLNSGGKFILGSGVASTIHGSLSLSDLWYGLYAAANPLDTDGGLHPQNLFRLLTRSTWRDADTSVAFKIDDMIMSDTPNRDGYSGVLLMARYADSANLYYAGVRQDGQAIIKKKKNGTYTTLASKQVFGTAGEYDRDDNPNLIPEGDWMRLKVRTANMSDGSVMISLYLDEENDGTFVKLLSVNDSSSPLTSAGYSGIRTDYMDVSFDNLRIEKL